jgi:hypothetical protein
MDIGLDPHGLAYEGTGSYGHPIWPIPVITGAKLAWTSDQILEAEKSGNTHGLRFREDSFDPVSRVRRGRIYKAAGAQPTQWTVRNHPILANEIPQNPMNLARKPLFTFQSHSIFNDIKSDPTNQALLVLGFDDRFATWVIVSVEVLSSGEELLTLRLRQSLGALPRISIEQIPEQYRTGMLEKVEKLADDIYRAGPESVIDRARDLASLATIAFFDVSGPEAKDLAIMAKRLEEEPKKYVAANCAKNIALLHSRAKPSAQARLSFRALREQDAELAVLSVGTILCEFGWAEWQ